LEAIPAEDSQKETSEGEEISLSASFSNTMTMKHLLGHKLKYFLTIHLSSFGSHAKTQVAIAGQGSCLLYWVPCLTILHGQFFIYT
jgi:hypothetical protein